VEHGCVLDCGALGLQKIFPGFDHDAVQSGNG
jgi:hypothetical protein